MKVVAIFINYRTALLTFEAVKALVSELESLRDFHVLVVENDSRDGSFETLSRLVDENHLGAQVTVLAAPRNGGYGYGINLGVRAAFASGDPEYIYVLNTDAFADPGSVAKMLAFMDANPKVGLTGNRIRAFDDQTQGCGFRFPTIAGELEEAAKLGVLSSLLRKRSIPILPPPTEVTEVEWVPGTSMLIRSSVFRSGVWFDEKFFLYFEEIDFAQQVRLAGFQTFTIPDATIAHHGSVSTGLSDTKKPWPDYWFDSRWRYFTKYHGVRYALLCDLARTAGMGTYWVKCLAKRSRYDERPKFVSGMARASLRWVLDPKRTAEEVALWALWFEDWTTHGAKWAEPGFWVVALHRLGERIAKQGPSVLKTMGTAHHKWATTVIDSLWKIDLQSQAPLGRRVQLGRGGILVAAKAIKDDVKIQSDVTIGPLRGNRDQDKVPTLEEGAQIQSGAAVLGPVIVGARSVVGSNSVALADIPAESTALGVPAKLVGSSVLGLVARERVVSPQSEPLLGLWALLQEDLQTYEHDITEGGLWVTIVHRISQATNDIDLPVVRAPLQVVTKGSSAVIDWLFGIRIAKETKLGRRVRIWHAGGIRLRAQAIGDDVHLRPNTSCEPFPEHETHIGRWPRIGDRADIGAGVRMVGDVVIGEDVLVGANTLVLEDVPSSSVMLGVPGRLLPKRGATRQSSGDVAAAKAKVWGTECQNPANIGLISLILEDFETHERRLSSPGFWALAVHRFGNWRMSVPSKILRAPLTAVYSTAFQAVRSVWGIDVSYVVKVGRRVRFDHHGALMIGAVSVGDDVIFRHSATVGVLQRNANDDKPVIGDRVEIGPRACIVGNVTIGSDTVIGPNTVVPANIPPGSTILGVPGRIVT